MNQAIQLAQMSQAEWLFRVKLNQFCHLVEHLGWQHDFCYVSARLCHQEGYLINSSSFDDQEMNPENLSKLKLNQVERSDFLLYQQVYEARSDLNCMIHIRTPLLTKIAQKTQNFYLNEMYAVQLVNSVAYQRDQLSLEQQTQMNIVQDLADKPILMLQNQGILLGERSIERAFFLLWTLQRAAENQHHAELYEQDLHEQAPESEKQAADLMQMLQQDSDYAVKFFNAMVRQMQYKTTLRIA